MHSLNSTKKTGPKTGEGDQRRVTVAVVLSAETIEMLDEMAQKASVSRSHLVREMIKTLYAAKTDSPQGWPKQ